MNHTLNIISSTFASTLRGWRGTSGSKTVEQPASPLVIYDREGCPDCRLVREALTELNLDVLIMPCPEGSNRNKRQLETVSGQSSVPFLADQNTGKKVSGAAAIIDYLFQQYRGKSAPAQIKPATLNRLTSRLASAIRGNAGVQARPARMAEQPLTLYSFESSPFSRVVRERLCELELPYHLVNLGKQQWADMGPAKMRFAPGPYAPLANTKRDAFFKAHGNVQVPYLIDPNTNTQLFESADILKYLAKTYAL